MVTAHCKSIKYLSIPHSSHSRGWALRYENQGPLPQDGTDSIGTFHSRTRLKLGICLSLYICLTSSPSHFPSLCPVPNYQVVLLSCIPGMLIYLRLPYSRHPYSRKTIKPMDSSYRFEIFTSYYNLALICNSLLIWIRLKCGTCILIVWVPKSA